MGKIFSKFLSGLIIFSFSFLSSVSAKGPEELFAEDSKSFVRECDSFNKAEPGNTDANNFSEDAFHSGDGKNFIYLSKENDRSKANFVYLDEDEEPEISVADKKSSANNSGFTLPSLNITKMQNNAKSNYDLPVLNIFFVSFIFRGIYEYLKNNYTKIASAGCTFFNKDAVNSENENIKTFEQSKKNNSTFKESTNENTKDETILKENKKSITSKENINNNNEIAESKKVESEKENKSLTETQNNLNIKENKESTNNLDKEKKEIEEEQKEVDSSLLNKEIEDEEKEKNEGLTEDKNNINIKEDSDENLKTDESLNGNINHDAKSQNPDSALNTDSKKDDSTLNTGKGGNSMFLYPLIKSVLIFLVITLVFEVIGHLLFWWKTKDATDVVPYDKESKKWQLGYSAYIRPVKIIGFWPFTGYMENLTNEKVKEYIKSFDERWVDVLFWKPLFGFFGTCKKDNNREVDVPRSEGKENISELNRGFIEGRENSFPAPVGDEKINLLNISS